MITIPTCELVRLIASTLPFAPDDKHDKHNGILLRWRYDANGNGFLSATATDVLSGGHCWWVPGAGAERTEGTGDDTQQDFDVDWGENGEGIGEWSIFIAREDAKQIVSVFKVPVKRRLTPLKLEVNLSQTTLTVTRDRTDETLGAELRITTPDASIPRTFPDVDATYVDALEHARTNTQWVGMDTDAEIPRYTPFRLARFGIVAATTMDLIYCGPDRPTGVRMDAPFHGFIYPVSAKANERARAAAAGRDLDREEGDRA